MGPNQRTPRPDVRRLKSPLALIEALETLPRDAVHEDPDEWIFRGVGWSQHGLLPSALRPDTYLSNGGKSKQVRNWSNRDATLAEANMLREYLRALQRIGLEVPGGGDRSRAELERVLLEAFPSVPRVHRAAQESSARPLWPPDSLLPLLALAQHHGLPTRLLDFTSDARIGAYFAAISSLRLDHPYFSVWAVHAAGLSMDNALRAKIRQGGATPSDPGAQVVFVDSSSNPRLRAQRGLFVLASAYRARVPDKLERKEWKPIERHSIPAFEDSRPRRYDLHRRHAPALLSHLARLGVDASTVYPDHAGAWKSVQERINLAQRKLRLYQADERRLLRNWGDQE